MELHELEEDQDRAHRTERPDGGGKRPFGLRADKHRATAQDDLAELETLLAAEPGLGRLTELLSRHRDARRDAQAESEAQIRDEAKPDPAAEARAAAAISARAVSLELLSAPFTTSWVTLDTPFLIWQPPHPNLDIFLDSGIVPVRELGEGPASTPGRAQVEPTSGSTSCGKTRATTSPSRTSGARSSSTGTRLPGRSRASCPDTGRT